MGSEYEAHQVSRFPGFALTKKGLLHLVDALFIPSTLPSLLFFSLVESW